jgi:GDP-L-fucose synthase
MILVTGASGVLGAALVARLAAGDEPFTTLASADVDLRDREQALDAIADIKPRLIYHLAAKVHGIMGNTLFPAEMYADNVRINANVVEAAHINGAAKIVAAGTVAIYSSAAPMPVSEDSVWTGPPHASEWAYGAAKRGMLTHLEACERQFGLDYCYPIFTNLYGPCDRFDSAHGHVVPSLIAKFHEASRTGGEISVWGRGEAQRDFIIGSDAAAALIALAEHGHGPVNVATGKTVKIRQLVEILQRVSGVDRVVWDATKPDGQLMRDYNVDRLFATGFRPTVTLEQGLAETYAWYSANYPNVRG